MITWFYSLSDCTETKWLETAFCRLKQVKILEGVSGFKMGLNIEDTSFSKSASLVDPYV